MTVPREIELKIDLAPEVLPRLRRSCSKLFASGEVTRKKLVSVYFDSKKLTLYKRGLSLRVRSQEGQRVQTLKGRTKGGGIFDRTEWNAEIKGEEPDLSGLDGSPFRDALSPKLLRSKLRPVFRTEVDRTAWVVRTSAATVEFALDEGRIIAAEKCDEFVELELELKEGARAELFTIARSLMRIDNLKVGVLAKSERGYALLKESTPASFKAEALHLKPNLITGDAFRLIVHSCIRHFRLNERLLVETRAAEPLHQCRVALRRLRSALSLFKRLVADDQLANLRNRLRFVAQRLGEARDLDVLLERLLGAEADEGRAREQQADLIDQIQERREAAYNRVMAALKRGSARMLFFDLMAWSEAGPWTTSTDPAARARRECPITEFAEEALHRQTRKLKKESRELKDIDSPMVHGVRIQAKKLRYAAEFFSSLADTSKKRKRHRALLLAVTALQERLGELNDMATGAKLAKESVEADQEQARHALRAASRAIQKIREVKPFWAQ